MMKKVIIALLASLLPAPGAVFADQGELVVYSVRKEHFIKPLFDAYAAETGGKIKYITGKAGALFERLRSEGERHYRADGNP